MTVHGDDFTAVGGKRSLDWLEREISQRYECTAQPRLGPGSQDAKSGVVLNRVVHWTPEGLQYEADPRQVERLVQDAGLVGAKAVVTPGAKQTSAEVEADEKLRDDLQTTYRAGSARANYLSSDRPDAQFACKEFCRWMSTPTAGSWQA